DDDLRRAALLLGALDPRDLFLLLLDFARHLRVPRERGELLPVLDGLRLARELVAQLVGPDERVLRDLLEQLHGVERTVIHPVLVYDVPRARVRLEARLERPELLRGAHAARGRLG